MYPQREIFGKAPLELVAAEVRYPYAPRLRQQDTIDAILEQLGSELPVLRKQQQVTIKVGAGGVAAPEAEETPSFFNRGSTAAAAVSPTALTVETTNYSEFSEFRSLVLAVVEAVAIHGSIAAVERVGIRYIDEVRVPAKIADVRDWRGWIHDDLLSMVDVAGDFPTTSSQGMIEYQIDEKVKLQFRFAAAYGRGVVGEEPLKRRNSIQDPSSFFVLDFDCFSERDLEVAPDFEVDTIGEILDSLHVPAGTMFQRAITDQLRDVFRGNDDES